MKYCIVLFLLTIVVVSNAQLTVNRVEDSPYPYSKIPDTLYLFHDDLLNHDELLLLQSIQGLLAKEEPKIYRDRGSGSSIWIADLEENHGVYVSDALDGNLDTLLSLFHERFDGYILCNLNDNSVNVANSLCGPLNAIAVTEQTLNLASDHELSIILDARGKDERWVMDNYSYELSRDVVVYQREDKSSFLGDYSILSDALHFYDPIHSWTTENALLRMNDDAVLLGWGDDEYQTIAKASSHSVGVIPADWGFNLSTLTNFNATLKQKLNLDISQTEPNTHTVCFLMSDGDNVQWMLNLFAEDSRWFGSENRGLMDIGWTIPPALSELAPTVMQKLYAMAERTDIGSDYFIAGPSGHTYQFPETYPDLDRSCTLMDRYMNKSDLSIVNILGNDYDYNYFYPFLKQESVEGLFYYDYSDYSKEKGRMDCFALKPVISGKYNLWGGFETCESLATKLNNEVKDPSSEEGYSLVAVHAWSNSVDSLLFIQSMLDENVRIVAPDEFVRLIRENICSAQMPESPEIETIPNPIVDHVSFRLRGLPCDDYSIHLSDLSGKEMLIDFSSIQTIDGWIFEGNLSDLKEGFYTFNFLSGKRILTSKIFKFN